MQMFANTFQQVIDLQHIYHFLSLIFSAEPALWKLYFCSCEKQKRMSSKEMGFLNPIFPFFGESEGAV